MRKWMVPAIAIVLVADVRRGEACSCNHDVTLAEQLDLAEVVFDGVVVDLQNNRPRTACAPPRLPAPRPGCLDVLVWSFVDCANPISSLVSVTSTRTNETWELGRNEKGVVSKCKLPSDVYRVQRGWLPDLEIGFDAKVGAAIMIEGLWDQDWRAELHVTHVYKGTVPPRVVVVDDDVCVAAPMPVRSVQRVFGTKNPGGEIVIDRCNGTRRLEAASPPLTASLPGTAATGSGSGSGSAVRTPDEGSAAGSPSSHAKKDTGGCSSGHGTSPVLLLGLVPLARILRRPRR